LSQLMTALMSSLLALLEGRFDEAAGLMQAADATREPEILIYFARHYAEMGMVDSAMAALKQALQCGFICAPETLASDAWFGGVRAHPEFELLLNSARSRVAAARSTLARLA
jgi:hypothetical protein